MTRDEAAGSFAKMREGDRTVSAEPSNVTLSTVTIQGTTPYTGLPGTFLCYKVVCREAPDESVWVSLAAGGDAKVAYTVGKPAQAPAWLAVHGYHLTAFETLPQAARYRHGLELAALYGIFECEALYQEPLPPQVPPWGITKRGPLSPYAAPHGGWPDGTVMAQRLTLLRRIPEDAFHGL